MNSLEKRTSLTASGKTNDEGIATAEEREGCVRFSPYSQTTLPTSFGDGTYIVGSDISAGTYRAPGGSYCYWERENSFGGTNAEIIANDYGHVSPIVTILASDAGFKTNSCGTWTRA